MSDFDEFDGNDDDNEQVLNPNIRKQLREAEKIRKENEAIRAELELHKRSSLFDKAGIPDSGAGALLRKAYDGETSVEAIRKAAEDYGILQPKHSESDTNELDSDLEALRKAQGATIGTSGALPDPSQQYLEEIAAASSKEEVMAVVAKYEKSYPELGIRSSRSAF